MPRTQNYFLYHNPSTMGRGFRGGVAASGLISTDKETVAERAINENGVIWCVGRDTPKDKRYYLYQRVMAENSKYNRPDEGFRITVIGKPTFPLNAERDITDAPYFPQVKKLISLGLQTLSNRDVIAAFEAIYNEEKEKHNIRQRGH